MNETAGFQTDNDRGIEELRTENVLLKTLLDSLRNSIVETKDSPLKHSCAIPPDTPLYVQHRQIQEIFNIFKNMESEMVNTARQLFHIITLVGDGLDHKVVTTGRAKRMAYNTPKKQDDIYQRTISTLEKMKQAQLEIKRFEDENKCLGSLMSCLHKQISTGTEENHTLFEPPSEIPPDSAVVSSYKEAQAIWHKFMQMNRSQDELKKTNSKLMSLEDVDQSLSWQKEKVTKPRNRKITYATGNRWFGTEGKNRSEELGEELNEAASPNNTCNIELERQKRTNKESGWDLRKSLSSWWYGDTQKYLPIQDDVESQKNERRSSIKTCSIDLEPRTLKQYESDTNQSNTGHQDDWMKQKDLKIMALEEQVKELTAEKESLVIRLSQICCVKLSDGNPNITDLSDPNRAVKLVGRFSELYDNQWTDSFQALCDSKSNSEEIAIQDLLKIVLNVYKRCQEYADCQNQELVKAVQSFTGVKVGDKAEGTIVQEYMHNLHIFRAKNYTLKMAEVKAEIGKYLKDIVDTDVYEICQDYIAECTEVCWLMCVKSPPMYISADKTDTFQHHLYTAYTASGKYVSYVVWPTLFQYKDGPIMQRGVAQGTNNKM